MLVSALPDELIGLGTLDLATELQQLLLLLLSGSVVVCEGWVFISGVGIHAFVI